MEIKELQKLLKEIEEGYKVYKDSKGSCYYPRGLGSKSYIIRRIDIIRDTLLQAKKDLKEDY